MIRLPAGVTPPKGEVKVIVRMPITEPSSEEADIDSLRDFLLRMVAEAEAIDAELPDDMAENHDHYAHGAPKR